MSVAAPVLPSPSRSAQALAAPGVPYLVAFAAAALGAGLGRAVTTSYLPLLLDRIRDAPGLIGTIMLVNAAAGFAVPLVVGLWSDRLHSGRHGRRTPFILGGSLLTAGGLAAIALGSGSSYLVLAASGAVAYVGLNAVTTAHRALVPECFPPSGRARVTSAQEFALLVGGLAGVAVGGWLTGLAAWAPFALAAAAVPLLALPTVARVRESESDRSAKQESRPAGYYLRSAARPGVRAFLAAQVLWVLGYAALPAFFILYADRVLGLSPSVASLWLAGFGLATGGAIVAAGRVRNPGLQKPLLGLGVALMGVGFLGVALATHLVAAGAALLAAAAGFGLISTLGFPLFSALIPVGEAGGYTALYFSVRAIASAVALPAAGWAIAATGSYRALFVLGGVATLAALVPLSRVQAGKSVPIRIPNVRSWIDWSRSLALVYAVVVVAAGWAIASTGSYRSLFVLGGTATLAALVPLSRVRVSKSISIRLPTARWWIGWARSVAALYALTLGAGLLVAATSFHRLDEALFHSVNALGPGPRPVFEVLEEPIRNYLLLAAVAVGAALLTRRRRLLVLLALLGLSAALAWGLLEAVYAVYDRPRPSEVFDPATIVLGYGHNWARIESFPSGHMAIVAALAGAAALVFPRLRLPLAAYVGVNGFTRVLFGAHFPVDVIAGIALGYASARLVYALLAEARLLEPRAEARRSECPEPGCARCPQPA